MNGHDRFTAPQRFRSLLFRLVIAFFCLLLPIFVMGLSIYHQGVKQLDGQIRENISTRFHMRINAVEEQLQLAQTQVHQLINETNMLRLSGLSDMMTRYERFLQLNTLQTRLDTVHDANDFVRQITVFLPKAGYVVRSSPVDPGGEPMNNWTRGKIDDETFKSAWEASKVSSGKAVYYNGMLVYPVQQPLLTTIGPDRQPRILVCVEYDVKAMGSYFENMISGLKNSVILMTAGGAVVYGGEDGLPEALSTPDFLADQEEDDFTIRQDWGDAYWECVHSPVLDLWFIARVSYESAFADLRVYRNYVVALFILFAVVLLAYGLYSYREIHQPLKLLSTAFDEVAHGNLDARVQYDRSNEFAYIARNFNHMTKELKDSMNQLYEQKILIQQAEIRQLQTQINPHFLYNSMFTLSNMIAIGDADSAEKLSRQLGDYFRYITRDARETVPLTEELDYIRSYMEVQRVRFGKRLRIEMQENLPGMEQTQVPRLIIQPIVENAFAHALEKAASGHLSMHFEESDSEYRVFVENSGFNEGDAWLDALRRQLDAPEQGEITGMINVHRRLKYVYGKGLQIEKKAPDILCVVIAIGKRPVNRGM